MKQLSPTIPSQGRIHVFDSLRFLMIFFIIILHISMTFMYDPPKWWYILSNDTHKIYTVLVNVFDAFAIPVLFFLSGYFTPASFKKKGTVGFLKDKFIHIAIPWILGVLFVKPLLFLFTGKSLASIIELLYKDPEQLFYSQAHYWFLGVLFVFFVVYALYASINSSSLLRSSLRNKFPYFLFISFIFISALGYYLSGIYIAHTDDWINPIHIISFKPSKIISYILIFILGICAWKQYWFTDRGWLPNLKVWRIVALVSITCYMIWTLLISPNYNINSEINLAMESVLDSLTCFFMTIYIVLFGMKYQMTSVFWFMSHLAIYSYGIYWIHLPVSFLFLYFIVPLNLPSVISFVLAIAFTTLVSWAISKYIFKKVPGLRNIF